jgi:putative phosphonate metabolism protein
MADPRFAIYFVPAATSGLFGFGSAVLGYDCRAAVDVPFPADIPLGAAEWAQLVHEPRTYGFHATLKAPFHLLPDHDQMELERELRKLAAAIAPAPTIIPVVRLLGSFIAVVPRDDSAELRQLAADCVTTFDHLRAPVTPADRARRVQGLSERQTANLDSWGYPYVFDDFRFHMTLTGRVDPARHGGVLAYLQGKFAELERVQPLRIDRLALLRQDAPGSRFRVICEAGLGAPKKV